MNATGILVAAVRSRLLPAEKGGCWTWGRAPNVRDYMDATALEWAQAEAQHEVVAVLRAAGAIMPRRIGYATVRGVVEPGGTESSLCVLGPAGNVADDMAAALGGSVIRDVYRVRCRTHIKRPCWWSS